MKNDELKPCPFCGGKAEVFFNKSNELWYVCCYDEYNDFDCCEVNTTWYSKKEDAIKAWNTRTEQTKDIDRLKAEKGEAENVLKAFLEIDDIRDPYEVRDYYLTVKRYFQENN